MPMLFLKLPHTLLLEGECQSVLCSHEIQAGFTAQYGTGDEVESNAMQQRILAFGIKC